MTNIKEKIKMLSSEFLSEIISIRRYLHVNPELAMEEYNTASYIVSKLKEYGISFTEGVAKTGIVAVIKGQASRHVIALRADMDALQITEENDVDYKSQNQGVMHACGHDVHMACLLGAAKILNELRDELKGTVKLIFQPSEEKFPGGAIAMINEGVLEKPKPQAMFGQHVLPTLEAGKVGMRSGKYMSSTDEIYLTIKGEGGHAATPELNIDPVVITSHIIIALQQIVSRFSAPEMPTVLSFGRIIADGRTNIIPSEVKVDGTFRTYNEAWRAKAHKKISKMAQSIADGMGGQCDIRIEKGYPFLVNDKETTEKTRKYAEEYLGKKNVVELDLRMTAEDFAYFANRVPSCFYRLGIRNEEKGYVSNLHSSTFDVDEKCIETGTGLMAWIAFCELRKENK